MEENSPRLHIPSVFQNRYKIRSLIGRGGMSHVYLAEDTRLKGKRWAIKEIVIKQSEFQGFIDEAKLLITLKHPYLPNIVDYYPPDEEGYSYLVMDYIEGETLLQLFEKENRYILYTRVIQYAIQLCDLLNYLHNEQPKPIVYRDLKPTNVMIDEKDHVRLIDFGIARSYKEGKAFDTVQMGTVGFAAPEQFEKKQTDHRSDIYSLGALIYFLLSQGRYYYSSQVSLMLLQSNIPPVLASIVDKMLKYNPDERYQNITEVKKDLEPFIYDRLDETEQLLNIEEKISFAEKLPYPPLSSKLILIANLSKRAGSSFITVNLAKLFSELKFIANVLEVPFEPYLFDSVGLEQRLDRGQNEKSLHFFSLPHAIIENERVDRNREHKEDGILWSVADPRKPLIASDKWTLHHTMKYVSHSKKASFILFDVGSYFEHVSIQPLMDEADLVLMVVDPMPSEIMSNHKRLAHFIDLKQKGAPIEFLLNRWTKGIDKKELERVLEVKPVAAVPAIELSLVHQAVYDCVIPYQIPEVKRQLREPLLTVVKKWIPYEQKAPWLSKWRKRSE